MIGAFQMRRRGMRFDDSVMFPVRFVPAGDEEALLVVEEAVGSESEPRPFGDFELLGSGSEFDKLCSYCSN